MENQELLAKVEISSADGSINTSKYRAYVRQEPNARWFNVLKVPMGLYCVSGKDSTKSINKIFRRIGEKPVIYDRSMTDNSVNALRQALQNEGFLQSYVTVEEKRKRKRRVKLQYSLHPGKRFYIGSVSRDIENTSVENIINKDTAQSLLTVGNPCNINVLEDERKRIVQLLQRSGYYKIHNEFISYELDTIRGERTVGVKMRLGETYNGSSKDSTLAYSQYRIRNVVVDIEQGDGAELHDSITYNDMTFKYNGKLPIKLKTLYYNIPFQKGSLYSDINIQNTYSYLEGLQAIDYVALKLNEADSAMLDCHITAKTSKKHSLSAELEGTNTAGDLGAAATLTYTNKNIFKGSEVFSAKLKGAYEAITGLEGYSDQNYVELSAEVGLKFPRFIMPFLSTDFRRTVKASSEISILYDSQDRPEFHRRVLTEAWTYRWNKHRNRLQHKLDLMSLNYVFMPWISNTFREEYLDSANSRYSVLRNSYENLFIMNISYGFTYNSSGLNSAGNTYQTNAFQIRFNAETAGNTLYGASKIFGAKQDQYGQYNLFNIAFSQYAKVDFDYAKSFLINERNSIAFHGALGIVVPYGNSSVVPYEKRYFAGGANSVRGWNVRELGPGSFRGKNGAIDFINQTGNIKLNLSLEYRTFLFWKLHGAIFVDAGNIWTTREYPDQEGGVFKFSEFYKQIAASYGLGFRFNFDYFILRFDMAMKAVSPVYNTKKEHFPILSPNLNRDFTFHFAVGLPF